MISLEALVETWRAEGKRLRERYGLDALARLCDQHASELLETVQAAEDEELDLQTAAEVSGYAPRTLREKLAKGELPNAGRKHAPRIRRGDLPVRKAQGSDDFDPAAHAASIIGKAG